jgi:hypothetical protein
MRKLRALLSVLAIFSIVLFAMPAKSLPSQGGGCGSDCMRWTDLDGTIHVSCEPGSNWSSCSPIIHCDRDEYGHYVNCEGQCEGYRCYWI